MKPFNLITFFFCVLALPTFAQYTFKGIVKDISTNESLVAASILIGEEVHYTEFDGSFELLLNKGIYDLKISYVGYEDYDMTIGIENQDQEYIFEMTPVNTILETATITGSKYERRLADAPVSINVIKSRLISNVNTVEINTLLDKVPGLQLIDGQANIRGGSGYSFGAGSRVMLLIDDVPTMQPDAGRPNWSDIPVENIEQVEVLKGASSVLYGSAALNGIINIRTGYASSKPVTKANISFQHFNAPPPTDRGTSRQWYGEGFFNAPNKIVGGILHKQKFKKLDLVLNGQYSDFNHYYEDSFNKRGRASVNFRYRLSDRFVIGMNSVYNSGHSLIPFLRDDAGRDAFRPLAGTEADSKNTRVYFDPYISFYDRKKNKHKLLMRYYYINNNNNNNQSNSSKNYYADYQHTRRIDFIDVKATIGATTSNLISDSELFGNTEFSASNLAGYTQFEKTIFDKVNLSAGFRYEYNNHSGPEVFMGDTIPGGKVSEGKLIKRFSATSEIKRGTFLRASYGEGYRFPTITERYIFTNFASFTIFPNVEIGSEFGWTTEVGIKQGFKVANFQGYLDYAYFVSRYDDMLEFTFASEDGVFGFQSQNIGNVEIKGHEINLIGQLKVGNVPINVLAGYTFIDPKYIDFDTNDQIRNSLDTTVNVLKYRTRHNFKIDLDAKYKAFSGGLAYNRTSHMITIDAPFALISEIEGFRAFNNNGYSRIDARLAYSFSLFKMSFIVNNLTNELYAARPGFFEEPRSFTVRLDFEI